MWGKTSRGGAVVSAALICSACSSSATLTLRDGHEVRGKILRSDAETVWVEQGGSARHVKREQIVDVTHPGGNEMGVGVLVAVIGGLALSNVEHWGGDGRSGYDHYYDADTPLIAAGFVLLGGGVIAASAGAVMYSRSSARHAPPKGTAAAPRQMQGVNGVRLGFEF